MHEAYKISKAEAEKRLERRYNEQLLYFPLTLLIELDKYIAANIENVRRNNLLEAYKDEI